MFYRKITFSFILSFSLHLSGTQLITGDPDAAEGTTFSFAVKNTSIGAFNAFYVASNEAITSNGKNFALARLNTGATAFEPLAPEKTTVNGLADQNNPFFGAKNNALALLRPAGSADLLVAVNDQTPNVVSLIQNLFNTKNMTIVESVPLHDAAGAMSSGVINLATNILAYVFAAVKPAIGEFGDKNSGIGLLVRGNVDDKTIFGEVDAKLGGLTNLNKAYPLDKTSATVNINSTELAAMQNVVTFHWNSFLQRLFIGLQTTANSGSNNGTRAVVVGKLAEGGGLELFNIAPDSAFGSNNVQNIVGVQAPNQTISIYDINTMYTSTGLTYLIVVGGNGTSQQSVFALPLVNTGDNRGVLANKNDIPENVYENNEVQKLIARNLTQPATTQDEMTQATDVAAEIGAGELVAGLITHIVVRDDTVYAFVGNDTIEENASGIYSSQALFNASGTIKSWSAWQRAGGTTDPVFLGALNTTLGNITFGTGEDASTVNTIFQTTWSNGNPQGLLPVTTYFDSIFSVANGGIQSLQTFLPSTPGLSDISLMIAGGIGTITLVQTGTLENDIIIPTPAAEFDTVTTYENGTIDTFPDAKIITISGGALNNVGPVTATGIGHNDTNGWLFVGGSDGLAVLINPDGSGWDIAQEELGNQFDGIMPGMSFKTIGSYQFVKKIIAEDNFLFVVTANTIDRINLATSNFSINSLDIVTVATKETLKVISSQGTILDTLISQACALVATTGGLMRISDGKDIRTITSSEHENWTPVFIPETAGAPMQLLAATQTNQPNDITQGTGGQFYVLTGNAGYNQSRINRFSVEPLDENESMQPTTVQAFDDLFVKNIPSFFLNFGHFNSIFATDGGLYFASRNKNNFQAPRVVITPAEPGPRVGTRNVGERSTIVAINFESGTEINAFERSQASGSWLAAGDFGMQVLE